MQVCEAYAHGQAVYVIGSGGAEVKCRGGWMKKKERCVLMVTKCVSTIQYHLKCLSKQNEPISCVLSAHVH